MLDLCTLTLIMTLILCLGQETKEKAGQMTEVGKSFGIFFLWVLGTELDLHIIFHSTELYIYVVSIE